MSFANSPRRTCRPLQPVISTIVMLRFFARRQRASMAAYFTNSLTPPARVGLLASLRGGVPGRAARGSVAPRKMACRPAAGGRFIRGSRPSTRAQGRGQPGRCPFLIEIKMDALILKGHGAARLSGEWSEDDYDVLCEGAVVGRIMKAAAAPEGTPWMWTLAFGHHEDRTPTHGYAATREAAMAAFAKSWRRE